MASMAIENGKRVEELLEASDISSSSYMLISVNGLSRKISIKNLRNAFCGDEASQEKNNLFYSCEKIDDIIETVNEALTLLSEQLVSQGNSYVETFGDLYANINELGDRLNNEIESVRNDMRDMENRLNTSLSELESKHDKDISDLTEIVNNNYNYLRNTLCGDNYRTNNLYPSLWKKSDGSVMSIVERINLLSGNVKGFKYGSAIPTTGTLEEGQVYFQYF